MPCFGVDVVLTDGSKVALGTHPSVEGAEQAARTAVTAMASVAAAGGAAVAWAEVLDVSGGPVRVVARVAPGSATGR